MQQKLSEKFLKVTDMNITHFLQKTIVRAKAKLFNYKNSKCMTCILKNLTVFIYLQKQ